MTKDLIVLFSRTPVKGRVKKRLAEDIGDTAALDVHLRLFNRTMSTIDEALIDRKIYLSEMPLNDFPYPYSVQKGRDLGERMAEAIQAELQVRNKVCLIGSDCHDLEASDLQEAFRQLSNNDVVLGPAIDGGYYLIGMKKFIPEIFENITWGTQTVLTETLGIAEHYGLKTALLKTRTDIDNLDDLPANWISL